MRVLLIAPTVDADDVGEAWVAFQWASRLAERHDVTLLTYAKRGAQAVTGQVPGARVVEWGEPRLLSRFERLNSMLKPAYVPFHHRARSWIKAALRAGEQFDVAFQPTPVAMRYPSPAAGLGIPLVLGPVGGGLTAPPGFESSDTAPWYTRLRAIDQFRLRHDPLLQRTYRSADCVLGIAPYVQDALEGVRVRRFEVMAETGLTSLPPERAARPGERLVRLLFVGRLVRTKGARDAIAAMAHLRDLDVHLDLVGDGFDRAACEELTTELGLAARVTFHGTLPRAEVASHYDTADIFVFPSYREPGGNVPFEAMGAGLPLIVADRGGPAAAVDSSCALVVTPTQPEAYARDIARAVRTLVQDPVRRTRMGAAARRRVASTGLWTSKVQAWERLSGELVAERLVAPEGS